MRVRRTYALALVALMPLVAQSARADGGDRMRAGAGPGLRHTPPKECPRLNGRVGYYANPWCSPAEQRAWDLWDARRHAPSARN